MSSYTNFINVVVFLKCKIRTQLLKLIYCRITLSNNYKSENDITISKNIYQCVLIGKGKKSTWKIVLHFFGYYYVYYY